MTQDVTLNLGSTKTGLTLTAEALSAAGTVITTFSAGYVEIGGGSYFWRLTTPPGTAIVRFLAAGVVLTSATVDSIEAPGFSVVPSGIQLSKSDVANIIRYGERITFVPSNGAPRDIMASVNRKGNAPSDYQKALAVNSIDILIARDATLGTLAVVKGKDKFLVKPQPHLPEREYAVMEVGSGENHYLIEIQ